MHDEGFDATAEDVDARVRDDFPPEEHAAVHDVLTAVASEMTGREPAPRVQMAVLLLADGDRRRLEHFARVARIDVRDVLMWAFYTDR